MAFKIIVALDSRRGIGVGTQIPWHLKADMQWFKTTTIGSDPSRQNAVIMGRKTWDSLPAAFKPLRQRHNIVITRTPERCAAPHVALDFAQALQQAYSLGSEIFVIGGGSIYQQAFLHPDLSELLITEITGDFHCDHFFPDYQRFTGREIISAGQEAGLAFTICRYWRQADNVLPASS